jgi:hypothetical protein
LWNFRVYDAGKSLEDIFREVSHAVDLLVAELSRPPSHNKKYNTTKHNSKQWEEQHDASAQRSRL